MDISTSLILLALMLLASLLFKPLAEKYHIPFAGLLVVVGFIGSQIMAGLGMGIDATLRYDLFHDLIVYVLLPLLIFEGAFKINVSQLLKNGVVILFFALPVMLLSTVVTATIMYYGVGDSSNFPWIAALLTGAVLASTDPAAVVQIMRKIKAPERLCTLVEGEALFNDTTAIITFGIFLYIAQHPMENITFFDAGARFLVVFFGGAVIGIVIGFVFLFLSRLMQDYIQTAIITIIVAYASFFIAEAAHVDGVMSVLVTGMILGRVIHHDFQDHEKRHFVDDFWSFNVYVAKALMFLLMGVTITLSMFTDNWLAMIIGIVAVLIARVLGVFGGAPLISLLPNQRVPFGYQKVMFMSGLRGTVTLALAYSLPMELPYWWAIQSIAFAVVLFNLFVQAPAIPALLKEVKDE